MIVHDDCKYYTGYKPCGKCDACGECGEYTPWSRLILIIKTAAIGDVVRTTTILSALKKHDPDCCITWITDESAWPLLATNPLIDRLHTFSADGLAAVQACEYDLVLNFEKETRALGLARTIAAAEKKGFVAGRTGMPIAADSDCEYALRLGLDDELKFRTNEKTYPQIIFEMAGQPYNGEEYILELSETSVQFARDFAVRHGLEEDGVRVVGVNTGCGSVFPTKRWTVEGFVGLIEELAPDENLWLVLLGGPLEVEFNREILGRIGESALERVIDSRCDNTLLEFMGIIDCCDAVVTADSLAMHLAIGRKKQVVALFGPTSAVEVDLFGRGEKILPDFDCLCCYRATCKLEKSCMESIDADSVAAATRRCLP